MPFSAHHNSFIRSKGDAENNTLTTEEPCQLVQLSREAIVNSSFDGQHHAQTLCRINPSSREAQYPLDLMKQSLQHNGSAQAAHQLPHPSLPLPWGIPHLYQNIGNHSMLSFHSYKRSEESEWRSAALCCSVMPTSPHSSPGTGIPVPILGNCILQLYDVPTEQRPDQLVAMRIRLLCPLLPSQSGSAEISNAYFEPVTIYMLQIMAGDNIQVSGSTPLHLRAEIEIIYSDHSGRVLCGESCRRGAKQKHKNHQEPYSGNLSSRYGRGSQDGMMPIILSSNSQKVTNLSNGEADISFKIPCPCGKHKEKTGYRVRISIKDHLSNTLADVTSDPIMIKDGHRQNPRKPGLENSDSKEQQRKAPTSQETSITSAIPSYWHEHSSSSPSDDRNHSNTVNSLFRAAPMESSHVSHFLPSMVIEQESMPSLTATSERTEKMKLKSTDNVNIVFEDYISPSCFPSAEIAASTSSHSASLNSIGPAYGQESNAECVPPESFTSSLGSETGSSWGRVSQTNTNTNTSNIFASSLCGHLTLEHDSRETGKPSQKKDEAEG